MITKYNNVIHQHNIYIFFFCKAINLFGVIYFFITFHMCTVKFTGLKSIVLQ